MGKQNLCSFISSMIISLILCTSMNLKCLLIRPRHFDTKLYSILFNFAPCLEAILGYTFVSTTQRLCQI